MKCRNYGTLLFALWVALLPLPGRSQPTTPIAPSSLPGGSTPMGLLARRELGPVALRILAGATRVQTFLVKASSKNVLSRPGSRLEDTSVTARGPDLGPDFAAQIAHVLMDDRAYQNYEDLCGFDPGIGFRVWNGKEFLDLLICFHCGDIAIVSRDGRGDVVSKVLTNFRLVRPAMVALAQRAFPDAPEIRALLADSLPPAVRPAYPVLLVASGKGYMDVVTSLLEAGADVNQTDGNGGTALMWAARHGHADTVALLLAHHAKVNVRDHEGMTALIWACLGGRGTVAALLLDGGAPPHDASDPEHDPLRWAIDGILMTRNADLSLLDTLVRHGARVDREDKQGLTALQQAVERHRADLIRFLLAHGADVNGGRADTPSALDLAAKDAVIVSVLQAAGAKHRRP